MKKSGATEISLLNKDAELKLSLVSFSKHVNGYMDRDVDIRSRNELRFTNGVEYRYTCSYPYKDFIETSTQFLVRVETDMKLNMAMGKERMISSKDKAAKKAPEVHFIMFEA